MPKEKNFHVRKFSPTRRILADYNDVAASLNRVYGLVEIDVTKALAKIEEIEKQENYKVSMTGWVAKCISQAVTENKHLNSFRKGGRKIVVFNNVDISIIVEITTKSGKKVPYNYVIRKVETKSVKKISDEIRTAQDKKIEEQEQLTRGTSTYMALYSLLPRFFRRFVIRTIITNPYRLKKLIGTVGITSLGMFIKGQGGWAVPFPDKTLNIALGGIKDSVIVKDGKIEEIKILCTTFLIDHNIVDGAPAARFISRLTELMGDAAYLEDLEKV
ncbi:MAG: 2-oxo acid dehydrogenase subunit E2 [Candidatus Heimdallarchaeota archaeon]|nr:2-oxo acid dehydrogenase subunit E2 [Candidatus Heimdallarchaeota archaeon]